MAEIQPEMTFEMSYTGMSEKLCREMTLDVLSIGWPRWFGRSYRTLVIMAAVPGVIAAALLIAAVYFAQRGNTFADIWYLYVLLCVFAVVFVTGWSFLRVVRNSTRSYRKQMIVDGERRVTVDSDGVLVKRDAGETLFFLPWGNMTDLVESPDFYCFGQGRQLFIAVPKKALQGREDEFAACLKAHYLSRGKTVTHRVRV